MLEGKNVQGPEGDHAVAKALEKPENFVLKPQREGGGEHLFLISLPLTCFCERPASIIIASNVHPQGTTTLTMTYVECWGKWVGVRREKGTSLWTNSIHPAAKLLPGLSNRADYGRRPCL